jgi:Uma2 family endonuclease
MSSVEAVGRFTPEEFLAWEETQEGRHEYIGDRAYAMTGASERHGLMTAELYTTLRPMVVKAGCTPWAENRRLQVSKRNFYFPDFFAVCGRAANDQYENDASLVIEVLSRSTRTIDHREKLNAYATLPSIQQYVMVEPDIRRFEVVEWVGGVVSSVDLSTGDILNTPYGMIDLDTIYEAVDAAADRG